MNTEIQELMKLFETQQQATVTIDEHTEQLQTLADLETERVSTEKKLKICLQNVAHYEKLSWDMLLRSPEAFGPSVMDLLGNLCKAKAMSDKPDLYREMDELQNRLAEIKEVTG